MPTFAYLIPMLLLFGNSPVSAMLATAIFATPPMVRATTLALSRVPPDLNDFGDMAGCTRRQKLWRILLPSGRATLMLGVNQVIMLALNMVIIASMIGAGGLGYDVLLALRALKIGQGMEAGIAIVVLAIMLDRLSQAAARQASPAWRPPGRSGRITRMSCWRSPFSLLPRCQPVRSRPRQAAARTDHFNRPDVERGGRLGEHELLRCDRGISHHAPDLCAQSGARLLRSNPLARRRTAAGPCRISPVRTEARPARCSAHCLLRRHRSLGKDHGDESICAGFRP